MTIPRRNGPKSIPLYSGLPRPRAAVPATSRPVAAGAAGPRVGVPSTRQRPQTRPPQQPQSQARPSGRQSPQRHRTPSVQLVVEEEVVQSPRQAPQARRRPMSTPVSATASEHAVRRRIEQEEAVPANSDIDDDDDEQDDDDDEQDDHDDDADDYESEEDDGEGDEDATDPAAAARQTRRESERTELVRISEQTGMPVAKVRRFRRHFGTKSDRIVDLLTNNDNDGAETLIYQTILMSIIDMLPPVERAVHKSRGTRNVYQYNQLISQLRETIADVQARRDRGSVGRVIVDKHIRPALMNAAQQMMFATSRMLAAFPFATQEERTRFTNEVVATIQGDLARLLQEITVKLTQDVAQELS